MTGVVLAAGRGIRLRPITEGRSKAMVPVVGKPLVQRVMESIVAAGVDDFVIVAGAGDEELVSHFEAHPLPGVTARLVFQEERLGMAHALARAAPLIDGPFVLTACDSLCPPAHVAALLETHRGSGAAGVLSLQDVERSATARSAVVVLAGDRVVRIIEKPEPEEAPSTTICLPLYTFNREILDELPSMARSVRGEYELQDIIQRLIDRGDRVLGLLARERRQVTCPADLLALNRHYLTVDKPGPAPARVGEGTRLVPPLFIAQDAVIGTGCTIGPNVTIERGCRIGNGVVLRNAAVLPGVEVDDGTMIVSEVVC